MDTELRAVARGIRRNLVEMSHRGKAAHLGSAMSCVDILVAAYWRALSIDPANPVSPTRDRLILSKGHAASALYATLAHRGFFPLSLLESYAQHGCCLPEHPGLQCVPGVEAATGSLGHGLPLGVGMALAARIQGHTYRTVVVMSDGELNEGSVWEAAMFAAAQGLGSLCAIVDYNKWQATGRSNEVLALQPLSEKWASFGWEVQELDGNDPEALVEALKPAPRERPFAIVAHTVKGKGVSFMEDDNNWHYRIPNADELRRAFEELGVP